MKKSKHSEAQIASALKEYENGRKSEDICRELGIAKVTFYACESFPQLVTFKTKSFQSNL